jgi:hypothetical protein
MLYSVRYSMNKSILLLLLITCSISHAETDKPKIDRPSTQKIGKPCQELTDYSKINNPSPGEQVISITIPNQDGSVTRKKLLCTQTAASSNTTTSASSGQK